MKRSFPAIVSNKCTGCFACSTKCPVQVIHMELNDEGFYYPIIDEDKCIDCGLCEYICPALKSPGKVNSPTHIYSATANDEIIRSGSSSGGIFALLANKIRADGGIVYGAAFDKSQKEVCHTSTEKTSLSNIMRSKYVQSRIGNIYSDVESKLKTSRPVLFSGTPCQINGLRAYLQMEYENLTTVDFMCHGVPSTGLFKNVVKYYERTENSEVVEFTFREKDKGWRDQVTKLYLSNGHILSYKSSYYYYYYLFLNNYTLRKSCLDCTCYNTHESDITLADNWGIKDDDDKGVSLVLINTDKGEQLYDAIYDLTNTVDYEEEFKGYEMYRHNYSNKNRTAFFEYYLKYGFDKTLSVLLKKAVNKGKLICILCNKKNKMFGH